MPYRTIITDQTHQAVAQAFADSPLHTRATPKQDRARRRVGQILAATVAVLEHHPPGDLSANLVAEAAGVPVSSIYRYFPTVDDLVLELYLQAAEALQAGMQQAVASPGGWRDRLAQVLRLMQSFLRDHPYYRALLILIAAQRGPQTLDHDFNQEVAAFLSARWRDGRDGFGGGTPEVVAATAIQMVLSLEELLLAQPTQALEDAHFHEMSRALERYLELYLTDEPSPATGTAPDTGGAL